MTKKTRTVKTEEPTSHPENFIPAFVLKNVSILLLLIVVSFFIYANTLDTPFAFDGVDQIENNPDIRLNTFSVSRILKIGLTDKFSISRSLPKITFALNYYVHQYHLQGYHLVNIVIHIITGMLLYLFIRTTLNLPPLRAEYHNPDLIALAAVMIWLVHPLHTQSVTYIVQRMNSLCAMFFLLAMLLYITGRIRQQEPESEDAAARHWGRKSAGFCFAGSFLAWSMAIASKESAATLPFFVFLYDWYFFQNLDRTWLKRNLKIVFTVLLLFGITAVIFMGTSPLGTIKSICRDFAHQEFTLKERMLTQPGVVVYYLSLIFYPHPSRLQLDYDFPLSHSLIAPATTLLSLVVVTGLVWMVIYLARRERILSFCLLWFLGNLVIESSVIPLAIIYEHRTYLPSMLVCLLVIIIGQRFIRDKSTAIILVCVITVLFSIGTYQRNRIWSVPLKFWSDGVQKSPLKARPNFNLGIVLKKQNFIDEAIEHYKKAIHARPDYHLALSNLGNALLTKGRVDEAIKHFEKAIHARPEYDLAHYNLGNALFKKGQLEEAIKHYREALRLTPTAKAHTNLGACLLELGRLDEAIEHFKAAIRMDPGLKIAYNNLGKALFRKGDIDEAIVYFRKAVQIDPKYTNAKYNLEQAVKRQQQTN